MDRTENSDDGLPGTVLLEEELQERREDNYRRKEQDRLQEDYKAGQEEDLLRKNSHL